MAIACSPFGSRRATDPRSPRRATVTAIAAGYGHSCALTSAGAVRCWGYNGYGQLGDGTTTDRHTPVDVSGLAGGVTAIAAGTDHTCALTSAGGVKCWGRNDFGQLEHGTTTDRRAPVDIRGLTSGVTAIASGYFHTCALTSAAAVKCWGYNRYGQLGDGTRTDRHAPVGVAGLAGGVTAITAGGGHTCALTRRRGVKCWGSNSFGELGDGTTTRRLTPTAVSGLAGGVTAIAVGGEAHGCALTSSAGAVKCWGYNGYGQLGDGTTTDRHAPVNVSGFSGGVKMLAAGGYRYTCALTNAGVIRCWGRNSSGQLGDGTTAERHTPVGVISFGGSPVAGGRR